MEPQLSPSSAQHTDEGGLAPRLAVFGRLDRYADALYGYDVFIAYRRKDGTAYAAALFKALDGKGYSCFFDQREYKSGEPLEAATKRHASKATVLAVLCTPAILERREPDWVRLEIESFLQGKEGTEAKVFPINFNDTLQNPPADAELGRWLARDFIWQAEVSPPQDGSPSPAIVESICQTIGAQRRDTHRKRFFRGLTVVFFFLSLVSIALAIGIAGALSVSEKNRLRAEENLAVAKRNLSDVYMNEARRRLALLDVNGANAFAAAALRQIDRKDARKIITEHPPFKLQTVISPREEKSIYAGDYDAAHDRFILMDSRGMLQFVSGSGVVDADRGKIGTDEVEPISVSPDGSKLVIAHNKGSVQVYDLGTLKEPLCRFATEAKDGARNLVWLDDSHIAALYNSSLWLIALQAGCNTPPEKVLTTGEYFADLAYDADRGHLFIAENRKIHRATWMNGSLVPDRSLDMQTPPGSSDADQPEHVEWLSTENQLAVSILGREKLLIFDDELANERNLALPRFTDEKSGSVFVRDMRASRDGYHLYVLDDESKLTILDTQFEGVGLPTISARLDTGGLDLPGKDAIGLLDTRTADFAIMLADPEARRRLTPSDFGQAHGDRLDPIAISPDGKTIISTSNLEDHEAIQLFDVATRKIRQFKSPIGGASWVGFDPSGTMIGLDGFGCDFAIVKLDGTVLRHEADTCRFSGTGFEHIYWYSSLPALALVSGWNGVVQVPIDPNQPARVVDNSQRMSGQELVPLSGDRFAFHDGTMLKIWSPESSATADFAPRVVTQSAVDNLAGGPSAGVVIATTTGLIFASENQSPVVEIPKLHEHPGDKLTVSADGHRIAVGAAIVNHGDTGASAELAFPEAAVRQSIISPDGGSLYAATADGSLFIVSLAALDEPADLLATQIEAAVGKVEANWRTSN